MIIFCHISLIYILCVYLSRKVESSFVTLERLSLLKFSYLNAEITVRISCRCCKDGMR